MVSVGFGELVAAIELMVTAREQGWFLKLLSVFKKKQRILVFGATGVGKTQLLELLSQAIPDAIDLMQRTEFVSSQHIEIQKTPFIFVDTPGQLQHDRRRLKAIREALKTKSLGIINVVSYGYHESRAVEYQDMVSSTGVNASFLSRQRNLEIKLLSEWAAILDDPKVAKWVLTVVSKADLWWDSQQEVIEYYESGKYAKSLAQHSNLPHFVIGNCSYSKKFYGVAPMSGNFEDEQRFRLKTNLLKKLLELAARGQ